MECSWRILLMSTLVSWSVCASVHRKLNVQTCLDVTGSMSRYVFCSTTFGTYYKTNAVAGVVCSVLLEQVILSPWNEIIMLSSLTPDFFNSIPYPTAESIKIPFWRFATIMSANIAYISALVWLPAFSTPFFGCVQKAEWFLSMYIHVSGLLLPTSCENQLVAPPMLIQQS